LSFKPSPALQALSHADFARYAFGRLAGTLAWQMVNVVAGFQVWKITRDPLDLGLIGLAQFLPFLALVLPGGQVADRFDRRVIIACAYAAELGGAAILLGSRCRAAPTSASSSAPWCC
jgi:MFS family permease